MADRRIFDAQKPVPICIIVAGDTSLFFGSIAKDLKVNTGERAERVVSTESPDEDMNLWRTVLNRKDCRSPLFCES